MADITDVTKLKPELQGISDAELQRRMAELQMEADRRLVEKERKENEAKAALKNAIIDKYLEVLREMSDAKLLPAEVIAFYTNSGGNFTPHLKHKKIKV